MTKIYDIIHLNNYMYMVDKEAIPKIGDIFPMKLKTKEYVLFKVVSSRTTEEEDMISLNNQLWVNWIGKDYVQGLAIKDIHKIIASNDKSLGLPLLPQIEEGLYTKDQLIDAIMMRSEHDSVGYILSRIKPAASEKKYTSKDMWKLAHMMTDRGWHSLDNGKEIVEFLQFLIPLPKKVEVEMDIRKSPSIVNQVGVSRIITNRPKVVNNIVQVKRWIP